MLRWISLIAVLIAFSMPVKAQTDTPEEWRKQIVIRLSSSKRFPPGAFGQAGRLRAGPARQAGFSLADGEYGLSRTR